MNMEALKKYFEQRQEFEFLEILEDVVLPLKNGSSDYIHCLCGDSELGGVELS